MPTVEKEGIRLLAYGMISDRRWSMFILWVWIQRKYLFFFNIRSQQRDVFKQQFNDIGIPFYIISILNGSLDLYTTFLCSYQTTVELWGGGGVIHLWYKFKLHEFFQNTMYFVYLFERTIFTCFFFKWLDCENFR